MKGMSNSVSDSVSLIGKLKEVYCKISLEGKKILLGTIFPEKIQFDGNNCRTQRLNEVLRLICLIDSDIEEKEKGELIKNDKFSCQVELPGVEPGSGTRNNNAFYMLSDFITCRASTGKVHPIETVSP